MKPSYIEKITNSVMKHLQTFDSFLYENSGEDVTETVTLKKLAPGLADLGYSPSYDIRPVIAAVKTFRKTNIKSIRVLIPDVATITFDASGQTTEPLAGGLRQAVKMAQSYSPSNSFFNATGGRQAKIWSSQGQLEWELSSAIKHTLRGAYMEDLKWPVQVDKTEPEYAKEWGFSRYRDNSDFDPTSSEEDFMEYLGGFPQVVVRPGLRTSTPEAKKTRDQLVGMAPAAITVEIIGVK